MTHNVEVLRLEMSDNTLRLEVRVDGVPYMAIPVPDDAALLAMVADLTRMLKSIGGQVVVSAPVDATP
jgi:hypothetical protein